MAGAPILVVDDAPVNLKLMRLLLTHEGYEVRTAERAEDALRMLSDYRPELILADIKMPGMDGLEMTRRVKRNPQTSPIRVVALTGCAMDADREEAFQAGFDDYITKPIDTSTLAGKVREILTRPSPQPGSRLDAGPRSMELQKLRRLFLDEGIGFCEQLLRKVGSTLDRAQAAEHFHQWIGSAGLFGYVEAAALSRQAEDAMRDESRDPAELRVIVTDLLLTLSSLRDVLAPPAPDYVVEAMTDKRIALIGLSDDRADTFCEMLEAVKAKPRLFEAAERPDCQAIRDCDLAIFHVRPETSETDWVRGEDKLAPLRRLLFAGNRQDLISLPPAVRLRAADFLPDPPEPQETLMRLAFALSRDTGPAPEPAPPAQLAEPPERRPARPEIVMADDDAIVRSLLGATLQNFGMCCRIAENGADALNLIRTQPPQVAVLDVNMPGLDGFKVLAAIRSEKIPTRVILLTSLQQEKDVLQAFSLGADDYVTKPFNPFEVVARLKRLLPR